MHLTRATIVCLLCIYSSSTCCCSRRRCRWYSYLCLQHLLFALCMLHFCRPPLAAAASWKPPPSPPLAAAAAMFTSQLLLHSYGRNLFLINVHTLNLFLRLIADIFQPFPFIRIFRFFFSIFAFFILPPLLFTFSFSFAHVLSFLF